MCIVCVSEKSRFVIYSVFVLLITAVGNDYHRCYTYYSYEIPEKCVEMVNCLYKTPCYRINEMHNFFLCTFEIPERKY